MDLNELLTTIFQVVVIPLLGVLTTFLVKWINAKANELKTNTDNELFHKYIDMLDKTITQSVIAVNQTYVDALKEKGEFTVEAQREAFNQVYTSVMAILSEEANKYLTEALGDLNAYITDKIEEEVKNNKTVKL